MRRILRGCARCITCGLSTAVLLPRWQPVPHCQVRTAVTHHTTDTAARASGGESLAALEATVVAATENVKRREKDVEIIRKFISGANRQPTMPEAADDTTQVLWALKEEEGKWTYEHLQDAEQHVDRAKSDLRDAEQRVRDAEQRQRDEEQRQRDEEQRQREAKTKVKDVTETIESYKEQGKGKADPWRTGSLCEKVGMRDFERISASIQDATRTIARAPQESDKSRLPLPCVIGTAGQGKTEVLLAIMRDERGIQQKMLDAYNSAFGKPVVSQTLTLFATFNQGTTYDKNKEKDNITEALIGRLLARHFNAPWSSENTRSISSSLRAVLKALSRDAGDNVLIILLVDELRKIDSSQRSALLDEICSTLSHANATREFHLVPIVSCLDVNSLFTNVCTESKRPLASIPLLPCPEKELIQIAKQQYRKFHFEEDRCALYINLCGGHYRTIEDILLTHSQSKHLYETHVNKKYVKAVMLLLARILQNPHEQWSESDEFDGKSLWDLVSQNFGVIYKEVDTRNNTVRPAIAPFSLMCTGKKLDEQYHPSLPLFGKLYELLCEPHTHTKEALIKNWELAVPIAEALYCALTGALPPYLAGLERLEPSVKVPAKDDYNIKIETFQGTEDDQRSILNDQRSKLIAALNSRQRGIYCPLLPNYPGIELAHCLYGVPFVTQHKMRARETDSTLVDIVSKARAEVANLQQTDCITVIYATNAHFHTLEDEDNVVPIGTAPYRTEYSKKDKVCYVRGEDVFKALEPLIGTVFKFIVEDPFKQKDS